MRHVIRSVAAVGPTRCLVAFHRRRYHDGPHGKGRGGFTVQRAWWDAPGTPPGTAALAGVVLAALPAEPGDTLWIGLEPDAADAYERLVATGDVGMLPQALRAAAREVLPLLRAALLTRPAADSLGAHSFDRLREAFDDPALYLPDHELPGVLGQVLLGRAGRTLPPAVHIDRPGWVSDFAGARTDGWGVASYVRTDACGGAAGPPVSCRLPTHNNALGEVAAVLLAHAQACREGDRAPVLYTDFRSAGTSLLAFRRRVGTVPLGLQFLLCHLTAREASGLDIRWLDRASAPAHVLVDAVARYRVRGGAPAADDIVSTDLDHEIRRLGARSAPPPRH